jgi:hypothetical protein
VLGVAKLGMSVQCATEVDQLGFVRLRQAFDLVSQPGVQHRAIVAFRISRRTSGPG